MTDQSINDLPDSSLIKKAQALEYFRAFHPLFEACWKEAVETLEELAPNVVYGNFARTLCELVEKDPSIDIAPMINYVEILMNCGTEELKDLIATYFLEALLAAADRQPQVMAPVLQLLGPSSKNYALGWNDFSGCTNKGLEK